MPVFTLHPMIFWITHSGGKYKLLLTPIPYARNYLPWYWPTGTLPLINTLTGMILEAHHHTRRFRGGKQYEYSTTDNHTAVSESNITVDATAAADHAHGPPNCNASTAWK